MTDTIKVIDAPYPPKTKLPNGTLSAPFGLHLDWLRVSIPHPDQPGKFILAPLSAVTLVFAAEFAERMTPGSETNDPSHWEE